MARHEELLEPSTQAKGGQGVQFNFYLKQTSESLDTTEISVNTLNLQSQQLTWKREMYWPLSGKAQNHKPREMALPFLGAKDH